MRQFKDKALSDETVQKLVEAGQSASTSSYLQTYSIIGVDDPEIKTIERSFRTYHMLSIMDIYLYLF